MILKIFSKFLYTPKLFNLNSFLVLVSFLLFISAASASVVDQFNKFKYPNNSKYFLKESNVIGYKWVKYDPNYDLNELILFKNYFRRYLNNNKPSDLPREINQFISSQYKHDPLKYKCFYKINNVIYL